MALFQQNNQISTDSIESPSLISPQLSIPDDVDKQIPSLQLRRPQINIIETEQIDIEKEKIIKKPPVVVQKIFVAPPSLTFDDSVKLNLTGRKDKSVNWKLNYDVKIIDEDLASPQLHDSLWNELIQEKTYYFTKQDSITGFTEEILPAYIDTVVTLPDKSKIKKIESHKEQLPLQSNTMLILLAIGLIILGLIRLNWSRYLRGTLQSIIYPSYRDRISSTNISNFPPSFLLGFLFYYNSTLFTYQILTIYNKPFIGVSGPLMMPLIFGFMFILFTGKILVYRIIGKIFKTSDQIHNYLSTASYTSKAYGVMLQPLVLFFPFVGILLRDVFIRVGLGLFIILYIRQVFRGVRINFTNLFSGYYIILYLCGLEILPLSILFKVLFK